MASESKKNRHIPQVRNYANLMRKTRDFHQYTFKLPRPRVTNALLEEVSKSSTARGWAASGKYTKKQLEKKIKQRAIDLSIDAQLEGHQKAAITRQWYGTKSTPGLRQYLRAVEKKKAQFIKAPRAQRSSMLRQHKTTNKGFFIYEPPTTKVRKHGKGVNLYFTLERKQGYDPKRRRQVRRREEAYVPFKRGVIIPNEIARLYNQWETPPYSVAIGVMGAPGKKEHRNLAGLQYITDVIRQYELRGQMHPFSGVYFYWY